MIRFKKDDGSNYPEWEEKGFYEVFDLHQTNTFSRDMLNCEQGKVQDVHYGDVLVKFGDILDCDKVLLPYVNDDVSVKKYNEESYIRDGDIVLADTAEDYTAGKVTEVISVGNKKILSGLHTMLCRPKLKTAPRFLGYYMNSDNYHRQVVRLLVGTKVYSINKKVIDKTILKFPHIEEQKKIADFLSNIDEVITASQQEISNLEKQKKGATQKLFSQEARFKTADGLEYPDWEKKSLDENFELVVDNRGKTPPLSETGYPLIEIAAVGNYFLQYDKIEKYVEQTVYDHWFRQHLQRGDILFSTVGNTALCSYYDEKEKCCVAQNIVGLRFNENIDSRFMFYMLTEKKNQKHIKSIQMNAVQPSIKVTQFIKLKFSIPCLEEQQKIADFLSEFDVAIEYAKQELKYWKELKKGLLQQMFM